MSTKAKNVDMTGGSLFSGIIKFSIPLMLTGFLQNFYHAADVIVAGRFAGREALAGVGASGSISSLMVALFLGLSVGVDVVVGRALGAKDEKRASDAVHTAMLVSLICGFIMSAIGVIFAEQLLNATSVPETIMPQAKIYMQITFIGRLPSLVYSFATGILSAKGDTKTALYIATVSGLLNIALNLVFVLCFGMAADGVALATTISQMLSAVWIVIVMIRDNGPTRLT